MTLLRHALFLRHTSADPIVTLRQNRLRNCCIKHSVEPCTIIIHSQKMTALNREGWWYSLVPCTQLSSCFVFVDHQTLKFQWHYIFKEKFLPILLRYNLMLILRWMKVNFFCFAGKHNVYKMSASSVEDRDDWMRHIKWVQSCVFRVWLCKITISWQSHFRRVMQCWKDFIFVASATTECVATYSSRLQLSVNQYSSF